MVHPCALRIAREEIPGRVDLLNDVLPVIEVVGRSQRARFLDSAPEGIVAEVRGPNTRIHNLRESVLEVPGVGFAGGIGEGIAVCVIRKQKWDTPV